MTAFDIAQHRGVFAPDTVMSNGQVLWWFDILGRFFGAANFLDLHFSATPPGDTSKIWYQPHATNASNGSFKYHNGSAWVALTPGALFTHLRVKAGYNPGGGPGGLADGDYGDVLVGSAGTTMLLDVTGVTPGTYGDSTHVPQLVVDAKGRITGVTLVQIGANEVVAPSLPAVGPIVITLGTHADLSETIWRVLGIIRAGAIVTSPGDIWSGNLEISLDGGTTWNAIANDGIGGNQAWPLRTNAVGNRTPFFTNIVFGHTQTSAGEKLVATNQTIGQHSYQDETGGVPLNKTLDHLTHLAVQGISAVNQGAPWTYGANYSAGQTVKLRMQIRDYLGTFNPANIFIDKLKAVKVFS